MGLFLELKLFLAFSVRENFSDFEKYSKFAAVSKWQRITFSTINQLALFSPHGNHSAAEC